MQGSCRGGGNSGVTVRMAEVEEFSGRLSSKGKMLGSVEGEEGEGWRGVPWGGGWHCDPESAAAAAAATAWEWRGRVGLS